MDYFRSSQSHRSKGSRHDSLLSPNSHESHGYSRRSRSSARHDEHPSNEPVSRNKSIDERERRPYHHEVDQRSRSSMRREETYPSFSKKARSAARRSSWPPSPSVEDEDKALAKEHPKSPSENSDEVCMPGSVDQNPVLIETEEQKSSHNNASSKPSSHPNRGHAERPPLKVDTAEPSIYTRRQPAPYAYSRETSSPRTSTGISRGSSTNRAPTDSTRSNGSKPARENYTRHSSSSNSSDERMTDDSDLEPAAVARLRERKSKPRVSFDESIHTSTARPEFKRSGSDFNSTMDTRTNGNPRVVPKLKSALRQCRSAPNSDDEGDNAGPAKKGSIWPHAMPAQIPQHIRSETSFSSKPTLQDLANGKGRLDDAVRTPPGSPRLPERPVRDVNELNTKRTSRPSSPAMTNVDIYDFVNNAEPQSNGSGSVKRNIGLPMENKNIANARMPSHVRHASLERTPRSVPTTPILPYPIDDPMIHMPNHEHFIESPSAPNSRPSSRQNSFASDKGIASPISSPNIAKRPSLPARPATSNGLSAGIEKASPVISPPVLPTRLPSCPRKDYSRSFTDWWTLKADSSFDICPSCLDDIVWPTPFRTQFVPAPPRAVTVKTRCDFASPWVRLAWLLTLKRRRQDLDLIHAISTISGIGPPCPESGKGAGPWYGIFNTSGQPVPSLAICSRDLKFIEALFPSLAGLFSKLPPSSSTTDVRICTMRIAGERFATHIDLLEDIDDEARTKSLASCPSLQRFIKLFGKPCTRDQLIKDGTWYFMPEVPDFTVCEECYKQAVVPAIKDDSELADRFNPALARLPAGYGKEGSSCQLYSARMRGVWQKSIKYGDKEGMKYLARQVRDRKDVELDIRQEQKSIGRQLERVAKLGGSVAAVEKDRLRRELEKIEVEWVEEWE